MLVRAWDEECNSYPAVVNRERITIRLTEAVFPLRLLAPWFMETRYMVLVVLGPEEHNLVPVHQRDQDDG